MYEAVLWRRQGKTVGEYRSLLCVHAKSLQSCPTLCNPMNFSLPGSSVHGILQEEYLSGLPFPPPGIFLTQGLNLCHLHLLHCLCQAGSLPLVPPGKPSYGWSSKFQREFQSPVAQSSIQCGTPFYNIGG